MTEEIQPGKIYTPKETRDFLKISDSTMKRMLKNGIIKAYKISGQYRIWGDEILRLISPKTENKVRSLYYRVEDKVRKTVEKW